MSRRKEKADLDFKNFITCKCGHAVKYHKSCGPPIGEEWCEWKGPQQKGKISICFCPFYRPDNLAHIEEVAKKKD